MNDESSCSEFKNLQACPCGKIPEKLDISTGGSCKWAYAVGTCCGEWSIEFRTDYKDLHSAECRERAIRWWNNAPRKENEV